MSNSSFLGADRAPTQAEGRDADRLGPSDSSDSGSDIQGATEIDAADELGNYGQADHLGRAGDSDAEGTGERGSALMGEGVRDGNDILPDRIGGEDSSDLVLAEAELDELDGLADDEDEDDDEAEQAEDAIEPTSEPIR